jgi:hypothetical protein
MSYYVVLNHKRKEIGSIYVRGISHKEAIDKARELFGPCIVKLQK